MSPSPTGPYKYSLNPLFRSQLVELGRRAIELGIGPDFAVSVRKIEAKLIKSPLDWGDPLYRADGMQVTVYAGRIDQLQVVYAVHDEEAIVFAHSIKPISGHPLYE